MERLMRAMLEKNKKKTSLYTFIYLFKVFFLYFIYQSAMPACD